MYTDHISDSPDRMYLSLAYKAVVCDFMAHRSSWNFGMVEIAV